MASPLRFRTVRLEPYGFAEVAREPGTIRTKPGAIVLSIIGNENPRAPGCRAFTFAGKKKTRRSLSLRRITRGFPFDVTFRLRFELAELRPVIGLLVADHSWKTLISEKSNCLSTVRNKNGRTII